MTTTSTGACCGLGASGRSSLAAGPSTARASDASAGSWSAASRTAHNFRRLRIRYERYPEIHTALLVLASSILCWRRLKSL
jgi:hypothetical protein